MDILINFILHAYLRTYKVTSANCGANKINYSF